MRKKGTPREHQNPRPLEKAVNEVLARPRLLSEGVEIPSPEAMVSRFQERLREESSKTARGSGMDNNGASRKTVLWMLKAAVVLAVFTAGYLTGIRGIPGEITEPTAMVAEEAQRPQGEEGASLPASGGNDESIMIRLVLEAPDARSVMVAADWNQWNPETHPLTDDDGDGIWEIHLRLQRGRDYQYQFVIDGNRWVADPEARVQIDDGFGGVNSLLNI